MKLWSNSVTVFALLGLLVYPTYAGATNLNQSSQTRLVKVLSDHPGAATALTSRQQSEIREFLVKAKGNKSIICTGTSLAGQRESMYRLVLLRAQLVCEYAKSVDPSVITTVKERATAAVRLNGCVEVVSK
jgi:hypothetical protein